MGLFKPGWMSKDEGKALRALEKVSSDEELFKVATECPHFGVQIRAVLQIQDASRRLDVALTRRLIDPDVRKAALVGATEDVTTGTRRCCLVFDKTTSSVPVPNLEGRGVNRLVLENRRPGSDKWNLDFVSYARGVQLIDSIRVEHEYGAEEPRLWVAGLLLGTMGDCLTQTGEWRRF